MAGPPAVPAHEGPASFSCRAQRACVEPIASTDVSALSVSRVLDMTEGYKEHSKCRNRACGLINAAFEEQRRLIPPPL